VGQNNVRPSQQPLKSCHISGFCLDQVRLIEPFNIHVAIQMDTNSFGSPVPRPLSSQPFLLQMPFLSQPPQFIWLGQIMSYTRLQTPRLSLIRHSLAVKRHDMLAWLSVSSKVQMICIWSYFIKIQIRFTFPAAAYPGSPVKRPLTGCLACLEVKILSCFSFILTTTSNSSI